jgi:hypothetical protein
MPGYVVRHRSEAPTVPCPCGFSTRILTAADGGPCSVHVTRIRDSVQHYHAETTGVRGITFHRSVGKSAVSPATA